MKRSSAADLENLAKRIRPEPTDPQTIKLKMLGQTKKRLEQFNCDQLRAVLALENQETHGSKSDLISRVYQYLRRNISPSLGTDLTPSNTEILSSTPSTAGASNKFILTTLVPQV